MALALIDETGDPGTGGLGKSWFCWVALVIPDKQTSTARALRANIAKKLRGQGPAVSPKQWDKNITGDNLIGALRALKSLDGWVWVAVASYTPMSTPRTASLIYEPTELRYYTLLFLFERVSWIGAAWGERIWAAVETPKDRDFSQSRLRSRHSTGLPHSKARDEFLPADAIFVITPAKEPLLNFAHCLALAFGKAVNIHELWGEKFPEYIEMVRENLWVGPTPGGGSGLTDVGITILPYDESQVLKQQLPFIDKWWVEHFAPLLGR